MYFHTVDKIGIRSKMDDFSYQPVNEDDEKLFQHYSKGIDKAVRETFPSIPDSFTLKPVTIRKLMGCGMFYYFKIALPDEQFATVSFNVGSLPMECTPGEKPPEQTFDVDPTPSSSQYD